MKAPYCCCLYEPRLLHVLFSDHQAVLFFMCAANELFFMALYAIKFSPGPAITALGHTHGAFEWLAYVTFPFFALKHSIRFVRGSIFIPYMNILLISYEPETLHSHAVSIVTQSLTHAA